MAAIFKKEGKYFIRFTDSKGFPREMELKEGRKFLMKEFEERKKKILNHKKDLQKTYIENNKMSIFFTTHNNTKGFLLGFWFFPLLPV